MRYRTAWCLGSALLLSACAEDELVLTVGDLALELCDQSSGCACSSLPDGGVIPFGVVSGAAGARRTLTIRNTHPAAPVTVHRIMIDGGAGAFFVQTIQVREGDAPLREHGLEDGPLRLAGGAKAELRLGFRSDTSEAQTARLLIESTSPTRPVWSLVLRAGAKAGAACVDTTCGDGTKLDFGEATDDELGIDFEVLREVTVQNDGSEPMLVAAEITDDGVPERPGEMVGEFGVFVLRAPVCLVVGPGETLSLPVAYQPFSAGVHEGELTVAGFGAAVHITLLGRTVGAHLCLRTEDSAPDDATLEYGDSGSVPQNVTEERRIWAKNCGYERALDLTGVRFVEGTSTSFSSSELPWAARTLAVGEEGELPVRYAPAGQVGDSQRGAVLFESSDRLVPIAKVDLLARIGEPERCSLVTSPQTPVDIGWVIADEANQGCEVNPMTGQCFLGGEERFSRRQDIVFLNHGRRPCTDVRLDAESLGQFALEYDGGIDAGVFLDPGATFSVAPGDTSLPVRVLFSVAKHEEERTYAGVLIYTSTDFALGEQNVRILAKAGGSPNCELDFQPVTQPTFFCPSASLAFGNVNLGQEKTIDLMMRNIGALPCEVTSVYVSSPSGTFDYRIDEAVPLQIPVNTAKPVHVSFRPVPPTGTNPFEEIQFLCGQNKLLIRAGNVGGPYPEAQVALAGKGTRPDIDVIPGELDFGEVTVGCCSAERRVAIYNSGDGELAIQSVGVLASSDPGFTTTTPADMALAPGEDTEFTARFCATREGAHSGVIEIRSTDDNEEYFSVSLTGLGTLDSGGNDTFQQPARPKVDVLWAIDDSGSMSEEQDSLAANFDSFINTAVDLNTDYHLGVVNTDSETEWAGKLYSCNAPLWISDTQTAAQQRSQFRCNVRTADTPAGRPHSDSKESALQAARLALDYPNLDGHNAGFYREDAKLYVILVTDEEDQSDGTAQLYVDYFRNLKGVGNPDLLNISSISGPPPSGCDTAAANQLGYDVVQAVGGQFRSICSADWSDLVASLGLDVFNARRQFPLSRPATTASIAVLVCSAGVCHAVAPGATNGWTFDAELNAVTFHGDAIPGPGEEIRVTYEAVCYP